jgi:hypothetical protein
MRNPVNSINIVATSLLTLALSACGSSAQSAPQNANGSSTSPSLVGAPQWVTGDCRQHFGQQQVICGVGAVSGVTSPSLARNAAMGRGRTEIARLLQVRVKSILTDYQSVNGGVNAQVIEENSKQITDMSLSGTRMAQYWIGPDSTYYALMTLGIDDFKSSVQQVPNLEEPLKQAVLQNATKAFAIHDDETSRY